MGPGSGCHARGTTSGRGAPAHVADTDAVRPGTYLEKPLEPLDISQGTEGGGEAGLPQRHLRVDTAPRLDKKRGLLGGWRSHPRAFIDGRSVLAVPASYLASGERSACWTAVA